MQLTVKLGIKDTTARFARFTTRKAPYWEDVPFIIDPELSDEDHVLLSQKIKFTTDIKECPTPFDVQCIANGLPQEFVIEMLGGDRPRYFYVDTQGYDYARYTFEYSPRSV